MLETVIILIYSVYSVFRTHEVHLTPAFSRAFPCAVQRSAFRPPFEITVVLLPHKYENCYVTLFLLGKSNFEGMFYYFR